jgi:error-prone DNA polymerase
MPASPYAELHAHSNFSFLEGASSPAELVARAVELGLSGLAVTDRQGLYGVVRFAAAAEKAGLHPVIGVEVELADALVPDPHGLVIPGRRALRQAQGESRSARRAGGQAEPVPRDGLPARPQPARNRLPGHREARKEDQRGVGMMERGPHLVLLARDATGYRSLCRLVSRAHLAGTKGAPRFTLALLAEHAEGLVALSGCRHGELARRLLAGDRAGARAAAEAAARIYGRATRAGGAAAAGFALELSHHLLPGDDWLVAETARLARETGLPVVVTNDVRHALPEDRELHDVLSAIRQGRTVETLAELRTPSGEHYLKSGQELAALPPGSEGADSATASAWREGIANAGELAAACRVNLGFEQYRFPGFPVPPGETAFSHLAELCHDGVRRRYHPVTPAVVKQLAHELDVIERTGLAEFFLICWDLMRFAKERGIPAQGRGSAADSIVAYALGITRVDPIRHGLLFERFINEGRTTYPDVDIDFSSERREEVLQYVYERYGADHTGMVCNLVTYRARSAVREVGYALGFPRPLVDRVAKALETYDSVMVRRDLEADGGFAEFFRRPDEPREGEAAAVRASDRGLVDRMGRLDHASNDRARRDGTLPGAGSAPAIRAGGPSDDEGGPGDTPASAVRLGGTARTPYSVARLEPSPEPTPRGGSTVGMSPWERWLEMCARIDGFPRHLSIHSGGMLVTGAPLIDIVPLERATMPGRVVVQFDKRDVETIKLIKIDLLGLGMLAAIDETVQLVEHDCAVCVDLDRLPEEIPEVFDMLQAADTVGVFQVESRAQMQTLPKSRPACLDDLVAEVAIIRPGPIQGNAVHPYLRRKQGLEPVAYLHPSLEPVLRDSLGVILYQEQVMRIAIEVAGFSPADSDGFRRAMGTWRSSTEMEKLHARFVEGCVTVQGMPLGDAEELYRQVAGFASFGFAKSHAAAFARTAYESAFLKLFYPAQFLVGLINAQPMGFYPVEVLVNDAKRHGVAVLPVDVNASAYRTTTEWVGRPGWALAGPAGDDGSHDRDPGEPLPPGAGIATRPRPVRSPACLIPGHATRERWAPESAVGWGVRLGLHLVKGIGDEQAARLDAERAREPYTSLADVVERTGLAEEVVERLVRAGALDSLGQPRRELLWRLRETARPAKGRPRGGSRVAGRPLDLRLPATSPPSLPPLTELERLGDAYAILSLDARRQVVAHFRSALGELGVVPSARLAELRPGPVRIGGLVVTRQHPMTARGTVFLALEDETGMVNVTLWPATWARLRGVVRRNALLVVDGTLQRESNVVNVVASDARPLVQEVRLVGGPGRPDGVRQLGYAGQRRSG